MAAGSHAIRIEGLNEFRRSLRKMDGPAAAGRLRLAMNISAHVVVDWAQPKVPRLSGRAAKSMKAQSTATRARVVAGGARVPYYPWLDFGGVTGIGGGARRPFQTRGRYIYESYFQNRERFSEVLQRQLEQLVRDAGLEVTRGG